MSLYLVGCDLMHRKEFGEYEYFSVELRKSRAEKLLQSTWAFRSSLNSEATHDALAKFARENDRLLVAEISVTNWAAWKAMIELTEI